MNIFRIDRHHSSCRYQRLNTQRFFKSVSISSHFICKWKKKWFCYCLQNEGRGLNILMLSLMLLYCANQLLGFNRKWRFFTSTFPFIKSMMIRDTLNSKKQIYWWLDGLFYINLSFSETNTNQVYLNNSFYSYNWTIKIDSVLNIYEIIIQSEVFNFEDS